MISSACAFGLTNTTAVCSFNPVAVVIVEKNCLLADVLSSSQMPRYLPRKFNSSILIPMPSF